MKTQIEIKSLTDKYVMVSNKDKNGYTAYDHNSIDRLKESEPKNVVNAILAF
jgi:hypothetical protein